MEFVIELDELERCAAKRKVAHRGYERNRRGQLSSASGERILTLDVQGIGEWAVRVLRNAHCPEIILRVYAQHVSSRWGLKLPSGGHGGILDEYCRIRIKNGDVDASNVAHARNQRPRTRDESVFVSWWNDVPALCYQDIDIAMT